MRSKGCSKGQCVRDFEVVRMIERCGKKMSEGIGGRVCMRVSAVAASYTIALADLGSVFGRGCLSRGWGIRPGDRHPWR